MITTDKNKIFFKPLSDSLYDHLINKQETVNAKSYIFIQKAQ